MKVNNDDFILFSDHLSKCSACLGKLSHSNQQNFPRSIQELNLLAEAGAEE